MQTGALPKPIGLESRELVAHRLVGGRVLGAVDFLGDGADLLEQRHVVGIEQLQLGLAGVAHLDHRARHVGGALAAHRPVVGHQRLDAERLALLLDQRDLGVGVGGEAVDRDHRRDAELLDVLHVTLEVRHAGFERLEVFLLEIVLLHAAVHLERADGGDDHRAVRLQAGLAHLDVEELLAAEVGAEAGFGHHIVGELERGRGRQHRVAAMRDVGERPAVDEGRRAFERLHQVRRQRILEQHGHGAVRLDIAGAHRLPVAGIGDDDVAEPLLQIVEVAGEAEDRHHLGGDGDVEAGLAREAVGDAAERADDLAQRAVVHVHHAPPRDAPAVDPGLVAPVDVVVDQRRQQVMRRRDGMEVAGEMQVDVFHRHDLRIAAAGRAALHAERRPERRFAQAHHRLLADVIERVGEADRGGGLALARRRRRDRGDQDQLAVRLRLQRLDVVHRHLGLVVAVGVEVLRRDAELLARDVHDRPHLGGLGDLNVGFRRLVLRSGHGD